MLLTLEISQISQNKRFSRWRPLLRPTSEGSSPHIDQSSCVVGAPCESLVTCQGSLLSGGGAPSKPRSHGSNTIVQTTSRSSTLEVCMVGTWEMIQNLTVCAVSWSLGRFGICNNNNQPKVIVTTGVRAWGGLGIADHQDCQLKSRSTGFDRPCSTDRPTKPANQSTKSTGLSWLKE